MVIARLIKYWWVVAGVLLGGIWVWGAKEMYFHQDDLDWLILANRSWGGVLAAPIGDHVNYMWRIILKLEWGMFGTNYLGYLTISLLIHGVVIALFYRLASRIGSKTWAGLLALILAVNTNWTETVLWMSGQTITVTALFVLLAMVAIWENKGEGVALLLASWTSALAIGLLGASVVVFRKLRVQTILILVMLGLIYKMWATDGTAVEMSLEWGVRVIEVWGLMIVNSVVGRLIIPFDRFEILRIAGVSLAMMWGVWKWRGKMGVVWRDPWSRFLLLQLGIYNLIVALGRAQYGVGIMRAERYAYLGLILTLLILARVWRRLELKKWMVGVGMIIVGVQCVGLWSRAEKYVERPKQMRMLFEQTREDGIAAEQMGEYLPHFVLNDERLKYGDIKILFEH